MTIYHLMTLALAIPAWLIVAYLLIDELLEQYSPRRIVQSQLPGKLAYFKPYGYDRQNRLAVFMVAVPLTKHGRVR